MNEEERSIYHKMWTKNHQGRNADLTKLWRLKNPKKARLSNIKGNAKRRGYKIQLTDSVIISLLSQPCVYCGKIDAGCNGIDRIDNTKGYIKNNCVSCCKTCNIAKNDLTIKEFKQQIERRYKYFLRGRKND